MATLARPLVVVTGASRGIALQLARQAAERGSDEASKAALHEKTAQPGSGKGGKEKV